MTRIERRAAKCRATGLMIVALSLATAACSGSATVPERNDTPPLAQSGEASQPPVNASAETAQDLHPTGAPAPAPRSSDKYAVSQFLGKKDQKMVSGKTACYIDFVYAGEEAQQTVWDEPCAKVSAGMIGRDKLEELGWWEKLDEFQRKFVEKMPGGRVLYVEGEFSAAVFPVDETGTAIEVSVAD